MASAKIERARTMSGEGPLGKAADNEPVFIGVIGIMHSLIDIKVELRRIADALEAKKDDKKP